MKALVVYDSVFGNTEKIAQAVGTGLGSAPDVTVVRVGDVQPLQLAGLSLLLAGSPTRAFRPTPAMTAFLKGLAAGSLAGVTVAAFDTRSAEAKTPKFLRVLMKWFGCAAEPMAKTLVAKGGSLGTKPEGFFVLASEGPLADGEIERAQAWASTLRPAH